jgi:hypothetical protein
MAIPFARPAFDNSRNTARLSDLILRRGQIEAEGLRDQGAIWGQMGQNIAGSMSDLGKRLADEPRRKLQQAQEEKVMRQNKREEEFGALQKQISGRPIEEQAKILSDGGFGEEAQTLVSKDLAQKTARLNFGEAQHKAVRTRIDGLVGQLLRVPTIADPAERAEVWSTARQGVSELSPEMASFLPDAPPADPNDPIFRSIAEQHMTVKEVMDSRAAAIKALRDANVSRPAVVRYGLENLSAVQDQNGFAAVLAGVDEIDPAAGRDLRAIVGDKWTPETPQLVEDRLGAGKPKPKLTPEETFLATGDPNLLAGHKARARAGRRPPAAMPSVRGDGTVLERPPVGQEEREFIAGGSLTKKALWEHSITAMLKGTNPYNSRSADPKFRANFDAITNTSAGLVQDGSSLPSLQAAYKALSAAEQQTVKNYINTKAFVDSATLGLEQAAQLSDTYPRTSVPKANEMKRWFDRNIKGDPNLSEFEVFVFNTARDYAKATSGSAGSVQQMTDAQIKASETLLNSAQNKEQFLAVLGSMKKDMANVLTTQRNAIATTNTSILGLSDQAFGQPDTSADVPGVIRSPSASPRSAAPAGGVDWSKNPFVSAGPSPSRPASQPAPTPAGNSNVPPSVASLLGGASSGRHTLSDGSVWDKRSDGSIVRVK